jgi:hypothetical protein
MLPCPNRMVQATIQKCACCGVPPETCLQHDARACRSSCLRCRRGSRSGAPFRPPLLLAAISNRFKSFQKTPDDERNVA